MTGTGRVVFVGAGPGAADLITLRGARWLGQADVVLYDALTDPALREFAPNARWIHVGKRGYRDSTGQDAINALMVRHAQTSAVVVRLKGGDPSLFGRLEEELIALAEAGVPCEVVPGVTAAIAAAAATQRPLTRRGSGRSVSLTTAMTAPALDAAEPASDARRGADTEVFYMAGKRLAALSRRLAAAGWPTDTPACVVSRAGWPDMLASEHTAGTLASASVLHAGRPMVVTVGAGARRVAGATPPAGAANAPISAAAPARSSVTSSA
jgi:uroporphyrin-III C-methyltransferase